MKASIDKLRWTLAGGSLLLLTLLVAVVGYGRLRAARLWKNRLDALGIHVEQTTENFTVSKTVEGRTLYTLRAGKAIQHKDGKTIFHNVEMILYGKHDGSEDRIYGSDFEYDDKTGVARALGDVEMDLRVPGSLPQNATSALNPSAAGKESENASRDIHVRTSGLTYVRKLGVAATDQKVMFSYAGLQCTARGAEFDTSESIIHLLADVQLHGILHGKPLELLAAKADLNHATDSVALANPSLQSGDEKATANESIIHLRQDGSLESVEAEGKVVLQRSTRQMTAGHLHGRFTNQNIPQQASLSGGVRLVDTNAARPMHGTAGRLDGVFDAVGTPVKWTASGGAQLTTTAAGMGGQVLSRTLKGDQIVASLIPGKSKSKSELSELHVLRGGQVLAEAAVPGGVKSTQIDADDLKALFDGKAVSGTPVLEQVVGLGHTRFQQDAPGGARQASTGNSLQLRFAPDGKGNGELQIASATQNGDVEVQSRPDSKANGAKAAEPVSARAEHSSYDGATQNLTLTGGAEFTQGGARVSANSLVVNQESGDSDALGNVLATLAPQEGHSAADATHIQAQRAHLVRETQTGSFHGSDAQPARLWQGPSQVEAATITMDGKRHSLAARPDTPGANVHAVFASTQSSKAGKAAPSREPEIERVSANAMDYDDVARVATFTGNLRAQGTTGQVQAEHAQMFFVPSAKSGNVTSGVSAGGIGAGPSMGGSLQKAVLWGDVRLSQPGKTGRGDRLVYTAPDATFVLTGSPSRPPQILDAERGTLTGASLSFHSGDNTVLVSGSGSPAVPNATVRVHTETGAKQ